MKKELEVYSIGIGADLIRMYSFSDRRMKLSRYRHFSALCAFVQYKILPVGREFSIICLSLFTFSPPSTDDFCTLVSA